MAAQHGRTTTDAVRSVVAPAVEGSGLFLEDVTVVGAGSRSVVRVTVDLPEDQVGSLDSDALGEASRAVSAALDADDVVPGAYVLEVSTPGTTRPLTELRHFRRARTRLVTLRLHDGGTLSGRLADVVEEVEPGAEGAEAVLVLSDGTRVRVADVRKGKVEVELKRLDDEDDGPENGNDDTTGSARRNDTTGSARRNDTTGSARHEEG